MGAGRAAGRAAASALLARCLPPLLLPLCGAAPLPAQVLRGAGSGGAQRQERPRTAGRSVLAPLHFALPIPPGSGALDVTCGDPSVEGLRAAAERGNELSVQLWGARIRCKGAVALPALPRVSVGALLTVSVNATLRIDPDATDQLPRFVRAAACVAVADAGEVTASAAGVNLTGTPAAAAAGEVLAAVVRAAPCPAVSTAAAVLTAVLTQVAEKLRACCLPPPPPPTPRPLPPAGGGRGGVVGFVGNGWVQLLYGIAQSWLRPGRKRSLNVIADLYTNGTGNASVPLRATLGSAPVFGLNVTLSLESVGVVGADTWLPDPFLLFGAPRADPQGLDFALAAAALGAAAGVRVVAAPLNGTFVGPPMSTTVTAGVLVHRPACNLSLHAALWAAPVRELLSSPAHLAAHPECIAPATYDALGTNLLLQGVPSALPPPAGGTQLDAALAEAIQWGISAYAPRGAELLRGLGQGPLLDKLNQEIAAALAKMNDTAADEDCSQGDPGDVESLSMVGTALLAAAAGLACAAALLLAWFLGWAAPPDTASPVLSPGGPMVLGSNPSRRRSECDRLTSPSKSRRPGGVLSDVRSLTRTGHTHLSRRSVRLAFRDAVRRPLCASYGPGQLSTPAAALLQLGLPALVVALLAVRIWVLFVDFAEWRMRLDAQDGEQLLVMRLMGFRFSQTVKDLRTAGSAVGVVSMILTTFIFQPCTLLGQLVCWWAPLREDVRGCALFIMSFCRKLCCYEILWLIFLADTFHVEDDLVPNSSASMTVMMEPKAPLYVGVIFATALGSLTHEAVLHLHLARQPLFGKEYAALSPRASTIRPEAPRPDRAVAAGASCGVAGLLAIIILGMYYHLYSFSVQGVLGRALSWIGVDLSRDVTLMDVLRQLPSDTTPAAGAIVGAFLVIFVLIMPFLCLLSLLALWGLPLSFRMRQRMLTLSVTFYFWTQTDVLISVIFSSVVEKREVLEWILVNVYRTAPSAESVCRLIESMGRECQVAGGGFGPGFYLLLVSFVILLFGVLATLKTEAVMFQRMEEADAEWDEDQGSEWSQFVYLPTRCSCCCRRRRGGYESDEDEYGDDDADYVGAPEAAAEPAPPPPAPAGPEGGSPGAPGERGSHLGSHPSGSNGSIQ
eukprot:TRINITY_DN3080_c0_g2_i1.p1 TRINITY_DN3080_c0_g2~~TRINITY_DN3080_c0_g2_i1.p1  ORF type:complete len:1156 (+),score=327.36 TRINITY_DN3080_c0_g2_i1:87-3470(+)